MKRKVKYFIAYYGPTFCRAWDDAGRRWVPYGMKLYITYFDKLGDVLQVVRRVKKDCPGWSDDVYIDSVLAA